MTPYLSEFLALCLITVTCVIHAARFAHNIPITATFHATWFGIYVGFCGILWFFAPSWPLAACFLLLRAFAYNQILNEIRGEKWFYIHGESRDGSWFDTVLEKIGIFYPLLWVICGILLIYLNIVEL